MSLVTALGLVLFVGFVATGLVGFFSWRQRMRDGAVFIPIKHRRTPGQHIKNQAKSQQDGFEGARL